MVLQFLDPLFEFLGVGQGGIELVLAGLLPCDAAGAAGLLGTTLDLSAPASVAGKGRLFPGCRGGHFDSFDDTMVGMVSLWDAEHFPGPRILRFRAGEVTVPYGNYSAAYTVFHNRI